MEQWRLGDPQESRESSKIASRGCQGQSLKEALAASVCSGGSMMNPFPVQKKKKKPYMMYPLSGGEWLVSPCVNLLPTCGQVRELVFIIIRKGDGMTATDWREPNKPREYFIPFNYVHP